MPDPNADRLAGLLQGSPDVADAMRRRRFQQQAHLLAEPVVVWGCGPLGRVVGKFLTDLGIDIAAFVDRRPSLWNTRFCDSRVVSPDEIQAGAFPGQLIIVGIYTSEPLRLLLSKWGRSFLTFPELAWGYPERSLPFCDLADPAIAVADREAVLACLPLWSDEASREEYVRQLEWRFTLDYSVLPPHLPAGDIYFPPQYVALRDDEHYVDCGAYDGDSIRDFLVRTDQHFTRVTAFEADAASFRRLVDFIDSLPTATRTKIQPLQSAVGAAAGVAFFNANGTVTSSFDADGVEVPVTTLDAMACGDRVTYVKMDIEGSEPLALAGATEMLVRDEPILAICLYHAFEHLWTIPAAIRAIAPNYDLHLGRHSDECWELVCYAVPPSRRLSSRPRGAANALTNS